MPQLIAIAAIGGLVYFAWRALKREMAKVGKELDAQEEKRAAREVTQLQRGEDGVYRPDRSDEKTGGN